MGNNIVGMDFHLKQLKSLIKVELDEVLMVGIYGIGGIGKTTISKAIYNDISSQFDEPKFNNISQGINVIKERLRLKRVLIVLDDVDNYMQLENLAGKHENKLDMHDLVQQMGQEVVRQEHPKEPGKRSRLWDNKDVDSMLTRNTGTQAIEGLFVQSSLASQISTNSFTKMNRLRLLKALKNLDFPYFELRYFHFKGYPLESLPTNFHAKNLVELNLKHSSIKQLWKGNEILDNLKVIKLSYSKDLVEIPDFSSVPNLEILILEGCSSLESLPRNFHKLERLQSLSCKGCLKMKKIKDDMENLKRLDLRETGIEELPSSIGHLKALQHLDLSGCKSLRSLSESICNLSSLETLILKRWLSEIKDDMKNLKACESSDSICNLSSLETLTVKKCSNLKGFPEIKDDMENLKKLDLSFTGIEELPSSIGRLKALKHLNLKCCAELVSLPDSICNLSSLETLDVQKCPQLERVEVNLVGSLDLTCCILKQRVIWWSNNLPHDEVEGEVLNHHVFSLSSLVEGISGDSFHLSALKVLSVGNFSPIERRILSDIFRQSSLESVFFHNYNLMEEGIPSDIWNLSSLVNLSLSNCSLTEGEILNHICHLSSLQNLSLDGNHFSSIPANIIQLSKLRTLDLNHCQKLLQIPELPPSLRVLDVHDCPCLETLSSPSSLLGFSLFKCFESAIEDEFEIFMPGNNGIPEWISHKKKGSEIGVELPENWWEDNNFLGFALCSVLNSIKFLFVRGRVMFCRRLFCNGGESNGVFVKFYPKVAIKNEASFDSYLEEVEECGLHLIYKTNILNRDSNATNHWPRLLSENTDFNVKEKS
ncbi:hypothetical protein AAG906_020389 [Vitis piasezkii]